MRLRILGPPVVDTDHGSLDIGGRRAQRMLAALLLRANQTVSTAFLVDAVWGESPPVTSRDQVYNCVAGLRRSLRGHTPERIELHRVAGGYQLQVEAARIDAWAFETALRAAEEASRTGDPRTAIKLLRQGLGHWYGEALEGIADGALQGDATRLNELRMTAYEQLFALEIQVGNRAGIVPELLALVRRYPLQERLAHILGTILHEAGRSAEALDVCRQHRRRLADEFSLEPSRELRALEREIVGRSRDGYGAPPTAQAAGADDRLIDLLAELDRLVDDIRRHLGPSARTYDIPVVRTVGGRGGTARNVTTGRRTDAA